MGKFDYDDDEDELFNPANDPQADTPLVKQLRKKIRELEKTNSELSDRASKSEKANRQRTVADVLKEKGAPSALARYAVRDLEDAGTDVTPEAVTGWLTENGPLFGVQPKAPENPATALGLPEGTELPPDLIQAYQKFVSGQASGSHNPNPTDGLTAKLNDPNLTQEELLGLITAAGN